MWFFIAAVFANPQLSGTWTIDLAASDSVEPILAAQGLSWIERKIAITGRPQHTITWSPELATIVVRSGWYQRTDVLPLDGSPHPISYPRIGQVVLTSSMKDGGIFTRADLTLRDGNPGTLDTQRQLHDDGTLHLTMTLTDSTGSKLTADRVFRRSRP